MVDKAMEFVFKNPSKVIKTIQLHPPQRHTTPSSCQIILSKNSLFMIKKEKTKNCAS